MTQNILLTKKTKILSLLSIVFFTIFIFGCGTSTIYIQTGKSMNAKSIDCLIEVFNSKIPERKFEELGILESKGIYSYNTFEKVLPKLKEKACENGGDAIIIKNIQKYVEDSDERIFVIATVIKWLD
ncbi:MAG: hypothetical protein KKF62_14620 [Bacteroidetes bacterium]|nr:hypothetical protein [Bacteroidota bacterium]MBU1116670.1 hypothetical protein [Bacteroidota bacterium]MBU1798754.1 hypothetical protein [Bacteroidota bacterium]